MKSKNLLGIILSAGLFGLIGCGQEPAPVEEAVAPVKEPTLLDQAVDAAKEASGKVGEAVSETTDAAADAAASAGEQVGEMSDAVVDQSRVMIEQVKEFLAADKQEMARELMDKLVALKDALPEDVRAEIERLEAMFSGETASER